MKKPLENLISLCEQRSLASAAKAPKLKSSEFGCEEHDVFKVFFFKVASILCKKLLVDSVSRLAARNIFFKIFGFRLAVHMRFHMVLAFWRNRWHKNDHLWF